MTFSRYLCLAASFIAILFLNFGCTTANLEHSANQLNEQETFRLVNIARYFLTKNNKFASVAEQQIIRNESPKIKIKYSSPKTGQAFIEWEFPLKKIRVVCQGKLTSNQLGWKIDIFKTKENKKN